MILTLDAYKRGVIYMLEFWKNEWKLFLEDLSNFKNAFVKIFMPKQEFLMLEQSSQETPQADESVQEIYVPDGIDNKVSAYFGESIEELRQNVSGEKTQHEVLREYAQFFKPYAESQEMCNSAFRKYYDRHALKIATEELPVEQARKYKTMLIYS